MSETHFRSQRPSPSYLFGFYWYLLTFLSLSYHFLPQTGASPDTYDRLAKDDEDYGSFDEDRKLPPYHRGGKRLRRRHLGGWCSGGGANGTTLIGVIVGVMAGGN